MAKKVKKIDIDDIIEKYEDNYGAMLERMDDSYNRLYMGAPFELDKDSKKTSITFADPRRYADKLMQICEAAKMQIKVRTPDLPVDKKKQIDFMSQEDEPHSKNRDKELNIQQLSYGLLDLADSNLRKIKLTRGRTVMAADIFHAAIRGAICHRVLVIKKDDKIIPDVLPIDPRFFFFGVDQNGLAQAGHITYRDHDVIVDEYGSDFSWAEDSTRVVDFWTNDQNIIQIGTGDHQKQMPQKHSLGKPPFTFCPVGASPVVFSRAEDDEYANIADFCQDIFGPSRNLYDVKNMAGSIWLTLLAKSHKPSYWIFTEGGKLKIESTPWGLGQSIHLPKDARVEMVKPPDIAGSAPQFFNVIQRELEQNDLAIIEYGMVSGAEYPSGKSINLLAQGKDSKITPILNALSSAYEDTIDMLCEQYEQKGVKMTLKGYDAKGKGFYKEFKPTDVKKPWTVEVKFVAITPEQDIQNIAKAQMLAKIPGISMEYILGYVLQIENFEQVMNQKLLEGLDVTDPIILKKHQLEAALKEGQTQEAAKLAMELNESLQQLIQSKQGQAQGQSGTPQLPPGIQPPQFPQPPQDQMPPQGPPNMQGGMY